MLYRSRLVPRVISTMGLIGGPLLIIAAIATMFGYNEQLSARLALATLPVAAWEFSAGAYLTVKGFKPSPITADVDGTPQPSHAMG